jgi:hypothetical protein
MPELVLALIVNVPGHGIENVFSTDPVHHI